MENESPRRLPADRRCKRQRTAPECGRHSFLFHQEDRAYSYCKRNQILLEVERGGIASLLRVIASAYVNLLINFSVLCTYIIPTIRFCVFLCLRNESCTESSIINKFLHCLRSAPSIIRRNKQSCHSIIHNIRDSSHGCSNHRTAGGLRFQEHIAECLGA